MEITQNTEQAAKSAKVKTVRMVRSEEDAKGGPVKADVHPAEVDNYRAGGWSEE